MVTTNPIMENLISGSNPPGHHFALCESCFWSATMLQIKQDVSCPVCRDGFVSLIPLGINESYLLNMSPKAGLEISFFTHKQNLT